MARPLKEEKKIAASLIFYVHFSPTFFNASGNCRKWIEKYISIHFGGRTIKKMFVSFLECTDNLYK